MATSAVRRLHGRRRLSGTRKLPHDWLTVLLHGSWAQLAALRELEPAGEGEALARLEGVLAELDAELSAPDRD